MPTPHRFTPAGLAELRRHRWFRWSLDLAMVTAVVLAAGAWKDRGHVAAGAAAPEVVLRSLDGDPASLASLRGRPAAVAFWAPWCPVCKLESRNLSWLARLAGDRARVVSVAVSYDSLKDVRAYLADQQVDYPVLLGDEAAVRAFRVDAYPTVYFLDAEGRVKGSVSGYTTTLGLLARLLL